MNPPEGYVPSYESKQIEVIPREQKVHENKNPPQEIISPQYGSQQAKVKVIYPKYSKH